MQTMISLRRLTGQIGGLVGAEYPYPDKFIVQGVSWAFPRRTRSVLADFRETEALRMRVVYEREVSLTSQETNNTFYGSWDFALNLVGILTANRCEEF